MKRQSVILLIAVSTMFGCESNSAPKPQASTAPALKDVPNADYECWKQFPLGTRVVRRKTMSNSQGTTTVTTTLELRQLEESKAKVESQVTVVRPTEETKNPSDTITYTATYQIPENMDADQFALPSPDARLLREEVVNVKNKDYSTAVYQWKTILESGPVDVTGWFCNSFPGRQVRLEFDYPDDTTGVDEIVDVQIPTTNAPTFES
jgi:hypothetical protein